jgi:hypothetical protein
VSVKTEDRLLAYIAAAATIAGGVLHLMMIGPFLKPSNFPMELLLYTDILFIVAGLAQIFWALPMIKGWGVTLVLPWDFWNGSIKSVITINQSSKWNN